jgi:hypothetical protein
VKERGVYVNLSWELADDVTEEIHECTLALNFARELRGRWQ